MSLLSIFISNTYPYLQCLHQIWFDCFLHKHCKCTTYALKRKQSEYFKARAKWLENPKGKYVEKHDPRTIAVTTSAVCRKKYIEHM